MTEYAIIKDIVTIVVIPVLGYLYWKSQKNCQNLTSFIQATTDKFAKMQVSIAENYVKMSDFKVFEKKFDIFSEKMSEGFTEIKTAMKIYHKNSNEGGTK